jgi:hypothetical protein
MPIGHALYFGVPSRRHASVSQPAQLQLSGRHRLADAPGGQSGIPGARRHCAAGAAGRNTGARAGAGSAGRPGAAGSRSQLPLDESGPRRRRPPLPRGPLPAARQRAAAGNARLPLRIEREPELHRRSSCPAPTTPGLPDSGRPRDSSSARSSAITSRSASWASKAIREAQEGLRAADRTVRTSTRLMRRRSCTPARPCSSPTSSGPSTLDAAARHGPAGLSHAWMTLRQDPMVFMAWNDMGIFTAIVLTWLWRDVRRSGRSFAWWPATLCWAVPAVADLPGALHAPGTLHPRPSTLNGYRCQSPAWRPVHRAAAVVVNRRSARATDGDSRSGLWVCASFRSESDGSRRAQHHEALAPHTPRIERASRSRGG